MQDLTPLHREVVNAIALNWDASSPEEIARKTRLRRDEVATVLNELEKVFIVERVGTDAQRRFYQLQERFLTSGISCALLPEAAAAKSYGCCTS